MPFVRVDPKNHFIEAEQWVPAPVREVFGFFCQPKNVEKITPESLKLEVTGMSSPVLGPGMLLNYRLNVRGLGLPWQSLIEDWKAPFSFTDKQIFGPYSFWRHRHDFLEKDGGTLIWDRVEFRLPLEPLTLLPFFRWIFQDIRTAFEHRQNALARIFA